MDEQTARRLVNLNGQFYQTFGRAFSATRQRIQPGVRQVLSTLRGDEHILDLGCGNGEFVRQLAQTPFRGEYCGLDFSLPLLEAADSNPRPFPINFRQSDLTGNDWPGFYTNPFDLIVSFAVLHHIPSNDLRQQIVAQAASLLRPGGRFVLSNWQFLNSPRLVARIQSWERAGLAPSDVDENDYLLDWRAGGEGLRYVHHFDETELAALAAIAGFVVLETFYSDGENGRLGLYQVWQKPSNRIVKP